MSADQLAAHLTRMREFWRERADGPDSRAEVCRLLLVADEKLVRSVGPVLDDPAWWQEQVAASALGRAGTLPLDSADPAGPTPAGATDGAGQLVGGAGLLGGERPALPGGPTSAKGAVLPGGSTGGTGVAGSGGLPGGTGLAGPGGLGGGRATGLPAGGASGRGAGALGGSGLDGSGTGSGPVGGVPRGDGTAAGPLGGHDTPGRPWQSQARSLIRQQFTEAGDAWPLRTPSGRAGWSAPTARSPGPPDGAGVAGPLDDQHSAVHDLHVEALDVEGERCRVRVRWPEPGSGEVLRVRWAPEPPVWNTGATVESSAIEEFGTELAGERETVDGRTVVVAEVPVGYHVYVPFLVADGTATVGRFVARAVAESVRRLRLERRNDDAVVSWVWPAGSRTAVVAWTSAGGTFSERVSRADYTASNGYRIYAVGGGARVRVRAITSVGGAEAVSPAREATLAPRAVRVEYALLRRSWNPLNRGRLTVRVTAEVDRPGTEVQVVVGRDLEMPLSAQHGEPLGPAHRLDLPGGVPVEFDVELPARPRRHQPYWIRCFFRPDDGLTVVDPPVHTMKVT
ncbi:hypothetical protein [Plantactinospora sp. WMMB782]|uniref:hypothetical protein n=1 Tax=Plantactinospora sp. WMMB782 TaxID=3404121 RepID=UPI003B933602